MAAMTSSGIAASVNPVMKCVVEASVNAAASAAISSPVFLLECPGLDHDPISGGCDHRPQALAEPHGPGQNLEALPLHRVDVPARHPAVGLDHHAELQHLARAVIRCRVEHEPFPADRVVEHLSAESHGNSSSGRRPVM
jgi:hypothetical protein